MKTLLITGGAGFVARHLIQTLAETWHIRVLVRKEDDLEPASNLHYIAVGALGTKTDWKPLLEGVDAVAHLAGRAHRMEDQGSVEKAYMTANRDLTSSLGEACAAAGVKRLVFLSSVKAMGESTPIDQPWTEESTCAPTDPYGISKLAGEKALLALRDRIEPVILRLPLVYGPGVKANMRRLFRAVDRGVPLPFIMVRNKRSLLSVGNLVNAIELCLTHPAAPGETFLLSDGDDLSTPELIRRIAKSQENSSFLLPVPPFLLRIGAALIGKSAEAERLLGSLVLDSSKIRRVLGWKPPMNVDTELKHTYTWYKRRLNEASL